MTRLVEMRIDGQPPFRAFAQDAAVAKSIFEGRYSQSERMQRDDRVRRVLDIGARDGAFARYAFARWPGCWIDCVESDLMYRALLEVNRVPGMRVLDAVPDLAMEYDVIRFAREPGEDEAFTDGYRPMVIHDYVVQGE